MMPPESDRSFYLHYPVAETRRRGERACPQRPSVSATGYDLGRVESRSRTGRSAALVAIGILCSRLTGLVRQRVFAHYFGLQSDSADAFMAAFRIPNFLQNLFGEGALSASFIPVYAALLARGDRREAARVAGAVAALLSLVTSILVLLGVVFTPLLIALI